MSRDFEPRFMSRFKKPGPATRTRRVEPRYWEHRIRDEDDWFRLRDYIHLNPIKHGYVVRPEDWPWSSLHRHIRLGWLDASCPGSTPIEMPDMPGE